MEEAQNPPGASHRVTSEPLKKKVRGYDTLCMWYVYVCMYGEILYERVNILADWRSEQLIQLKRSACSMLPTPVGRWAT